jgi:hypothetical protein
MKTMWRIAVVALIILTMLTTLFISEVKAQVASSEKVYVGVTFGGTTVQEAKQLVDKVKAYANLFVVASWTIDGGPNGSALTQICDYASAANMYFIVYFNFIFQNYTASISGRYNSTTWQDYGMTPWHRPWLNEARERYGDKFLGAYLYDEPGGKQIDCGYWNKNNTTFAGSPITIYRNISSYADVARIYMSSIARSGSMQVLTNTSYRYNLNYTVPVFVSDYALFWFDYKAGYSTVFTEIGELHDKNSKIRQIALCRGAAAAQNKDWGAIITFENYNPPTPENETTMLNDMTMAYNAGAKYVVVFNHQVNGKDGLTDEQFNAMRQFWNNIHSSEANSQGKYKGQVAFMLPTNYGWGMRTVHDNIWGFWPADNTSSQIWDNMNKLIDKYGLNLDIVYVDPGVASQGLYTKTYLWNETLNFGIESVLSNEGVVIAFVLGPVGAVVCASTYVLARRKKQNGSRMDAPETLSYGEIKDVYIREVPSPKQQIGINEIAERNTELVRIFNSFADVADPLFDLLTSLHGYADWTGAENCLNRCKLAKVLGVKQATENLNFQNLSYSIKNQHSQVIIRETESAIKSLYSNALSLVTGSSVSGDVQEKYNSLKSVIFSYLMFDDVLLSQVVDEEVHEERSELANFLDNLSQKTKRDLFAEFNVLLRNNRISYIVVDESRVLLRKKLNEFLSRAPVGL